MNIETLSYTDRECLLDRLRGGVFHLTTRDAYEAIQKAGEISNNKSARFPLNTSSQNSLGRLLGCVCLFDLRNDTPEVIQNTLECYYFLGPTWFARHEDDCIVWDLAYLFLSPEYYDLIIPNSEVHDYYKKTGKYLHAIPASEVWVKDKIPLSWIEKVFLVTIREPAPDRTTPAGMHYWAVLKAHEGKQR
ncbi:hypothetical protein EPO44_01260 [bacterium]|nr:MAG: hypothetical protein EPO44_01260 [bacterium]